MMVSYASLCNKYVVYYVNLSFVENVWDLYSFLSFSIFMDIWILSQNEPATGSDNFSESFCAKSL